MIQENIEQPSTNSTNFLDELVWKENSKAKWYLDKRECLQVENNQNQDFDIITFDMGGFDIEQQEENKIHAEEYVICELGKLKVNKIEENKAFLQLGETEIDIQLTLCKKKLKFNFLIVGKTKNHLIENIEININSKVSYLKDILTEYLDISRTIILIHFKYNQLTDEDVYLHSLEISENDTFVILFKEQEEIIYKRSTSKDYTWTDQKNFIPFTVDKKIIVNGFGFFRHYETHTAAYDFYLYEVDKINNQNRKLILVLNNAKVLPGDQVDSLFIKKVSVAPVILRPGVKYYAYVFYKINDMKTYYSNSGTAIQTFEGVTFSILEENEKDMRSSSTSGHMPYIYFKLFNPYEE